MRERNFTSLIKVKGQWGFWYETLTDHERALTSWQADNGYGVLAQQLVDPARVFDDEYRRAYDGDIQAQDILTQKQCVKCKSNVPYLVGNRCVCCAMLHSDWCDQSYRVDALSAAKKILDRLDGFVRENAEANGHVIFYHRPVNFINLLVTIKNIGRNNQGYKDLSRYGYIRIGYTWSREGPPLIPCLLYTSPSPRD